jgi:DNA-binding IclR family transcriptional regulator
VSIVDAPKYRGRSRGVAVRRPGDRTNVSRSATRALDVLEYFGLAREPLRAFEISRRLGMSPSTTNQLLKTMVASSHLVFDARSKAYLPSPRLALFSRWLRELYGDGGSLETLVRDVQSQTGMTVTICVQNDLFMQLLDVSAVADSGTERGMQIGIFGSATGSALLTMLDDAEIARLAQRARIDPADFADLMCRIIQIRSDGYADGSIDGQANWSIAVPLTGLHVPAVLGLSGSREEVIPRIDELHQLMRAAVERWIDASHHSSEQDREGDRPST